MPKTSGNSTYSPDSPNSPKQPQQPSLAIFRQVFRCLLETREEPDSGGVVMPQCVYWASQLPSEIKSHFFDEGLDFRGRFFSWLDSNLFFLFWLDLMCLFLCLPCLLQNCTILFMTCLRVCVDCTDTFGDDGFLRVFVCVCVHSCVHGGWFFGESFPLCLLTQESTWCIRLIDTNSILVSWLSTKWFI